MSDDTPVPTEPAPAPGRAQPQARPTYWFPLVLFGLLSWAAAPLYPRIPLPAGWVAYAPLQSSPAYASSLTFFFSSRRFLPFGPWFVNTSFLLGWYWLEALVGGYLLTLAWYRWQARRAGTAVPGRGYRIAGVVLTVAGLVLPLVWAALASRWQPTLLADLWMQGTVEFLAIAVGLWIFTGSERSRGLAVIALIYTATALVANFWQPAAALPVVLLPGTVLLLAGLGALAVWLRSRPA
ncbi:MAG TPA: hypothetical protein VIX86_12930 [Streptosporangiaceae bacterium]